MPEPISFTTQFDDTAAVAALVANDAVVPVWRAARPANASGLMATAGTGSITIEAHAGATGIASASTAVSVIHYIA